MKNQIKQITTTYDKGGDGATILFTRSNRIARHYKYTEKNARNIAIYMDINRYKWTFQIFSAPQKLIDTRK